MKAKCEESITNEVYNYVFFRKHEKNEMLSQEDISILTLRICDAMSFKKIASTLKRSVVKIQKILVEAVSKIRIYLSRKESGEVILPQSKEWFILDMKKPPEDHPVLVAIDNRGKYLMDIALMIEDNWFDHQNGQLIDKSNGCITHWTPLPMVPNAVNQ